MNMRIAMVIAAILCLAGCGTPGAPRPPSLRLPRTVGDLAATRVGDTVTLTWTEPERTTDGEIIRKLGPTLICMGVNDFPMGGCDQAVADLSQSQFASCAPKMGQAVTCGVTLPVPLQQQYPLGQATFAVEVENANGKSAGLSNQVQVPTAPTLPPPPQVNAKVTATAIVVNASQTEEPLPPGKLEFRLHLFRKEQESNQAIDLGAGALNRITGTSEDFTFFDRSFEWQKTYSYWVEFLTTGEFAGGKGFEVWGQPSRPVEVTANDVFPPAAPTGLQAVASGVGQPPFIDLTWAPNTESDLAGYNVYRREAGEPWVKINTGLVKAPAYRDKNVTRGHKYFYAVTAVDLRGNESGKSAETSENVP